MIAQSTIERVKDADILTVVRNFVTDPPLKKAGTSWKACSPFSKGEKTPSFFVVPAKNIFKCFSSGKGGGPLTFVMEHEGVGYVEAIKIVAGIVNEVVEYDELPDNHKEEADKREGLYKINKAASVKFCEELRGLPADHPAKLELAKRGFTDDTIIQWQIGYAPGDTTGFKPNDWKFLTNLFGDKSYEGAMELGLISTKSGHTYDFFRHRLMYPIHNAEGRIIGFGGRALPSRVEQPETESDYKPAKYINSKESRVYVKESVLYGLYYASKAIRACGYAYLSEGYTDVVSFHQAGYNCMVSTCGTALTAKHCELLKRHCNKVYLFGDGDEAGQKGMLRSIDLLAQHGFEVMVVPMPEMEDGRKVDPDELTRMFTTVVES